jgi:hypothetical protein
MTPYYLGCDVSKGYADFVIIDKNKQPMVKNFPGYFPVLDRSSQIRSVCRHGEYRWL